VTGARSNRLHCSDLDRTEGARRTRIALRGEKQAPFKISRLSIGLKQYSQTELNVSFTAADAGNDLPKLRIGDIRHRLTEGGMIEYVLELSAELNAL